VKERGKGKGKSFGRGSIPIPVVGGDDAELSDQDLAVFDAYGGAAAFLDNLDQKGIAR
jgi:hypothetical protein